MNTESPASPRHVVRRLLEGLHRQRDELGDVAETLLALLKTAGQKPARTQSPDRERSS